MIQIGRSPGARIIMPMTPARTASHGLGTPPPLQLWLHAVLMLFAELVSRAVSTLQMVLVRCTRDWHTKASHEDLPRETSSISENGANNEARPQPAPETASGRASAPPPNGGGATRAPIATLAIRWGSALSNSPVTTSKARTRRTTVPHLTFARSAHHACSSSPVRGRTNSAHA